MTVPKSEPGLNLEIEAISARQGQALTFTAAGSDPDAGQTSWATVLQFMKPGQSFIFMSPQNTGLPHSFFRISEY